MSRSSPHGFAQCADRAFLRQLCKLHPQFSSWHWWERGCYTVDNVLKNVADS